MSFSHKATFVIRDGGREGVGGAGDIGSALNAEKQSVKTQETGEVGCEDQLPTR